MDLLTDDQLQRSAVVANCRMNRERDLLGSNGYGPELGLEPLDFLKGRAASGRTAAWLDLCCGTARALIRAATLMHAEGLAPQVEIVGVDLVGMLHRPDFGCPPRSAGARREVHPNVLGPRPLVRMTAPVPEEAVPCRSPIAA